MHGGRKMEQLLLSGRVRLVDGLVLDPYNQAVYGGVSPTLLASNSGTHQFYVLQVRRIEE